jgi:superfamily II DNA or RNA helicase
MSKVNKYSSINIKNKFKTILEEFASKKPGYYKSLRLNTNISNLLFSYQRFHLINLINSINNNNIAFDGSSTGTGKTYTSIALCCQLRINPIIICPKGSRSMWKDVCDRFKINAISIINYELLRKCKMYDNNDKKVKCPFISKTEDDKYVWNIENPKYTIIIFDEVHHCKNPNSKLGKILLSSKKKCKILLLSATLYDKINDFIIFGYMLGLYKTMRAGKTWLKWIIRQDIKNINKNEKSIMYDEIFPSYGSRMDIEDICNHSDFPRNTITTDCYDINIKDEDKKNLNLNIKKLNKGMNLSEIIKIRQKIEKYKIPIIINEIIKYYELGKSIVVFINFINTLEAIKIKLDEHGLEYGIIQGGQTPEERINQTELFQYNKIRIIICTIQSGGESISLHDKFGTHPRISLISPSLSSIDIIQSLGRIYRMECKTPCLQKIIFCAGTYEQKISSIIKNKLDDINKLTDDDLFCGE